ncbi:D-alanine--D-alanine ligase [Streptomyces prasinosporus]|uniref:D-alanine--D-alanine ligase n=2 Tax=Streptomyces TaxID=1883 RepID=A0ABP6U0M4_9ACTN|nr:D-alanine--D-alanine ligase [Streptomyces tricolor]MCG0062084.1 D-alanine--D-alanine ligase [Streptomyces tricolor]GHC14643.1 D-alanine--D-alanine ligase [Streptomyces albogriseolus]
MRIAPLDPADIRDPIAVITGGWSREKDRSWLSGNTVAEALSEMGVKTLVLDLADNRDTLLEGLAEASKAFLAIAGRGAEDGRLQGLLETLDIPYTGSGVLASAIGMNKITAKTVVSAAGVRVPRGTRIDPTATAEDESLRVSRMLELPVMVKPVSEGGSIGLQVAPTVDSLAQALIDVADGELMAEAFIPGRAVSVGVLEDQLGVVHVLPALEARTPNGIYSYAAKRGDAECDYHCPARVSPDTLADLQRQAAAAHCALYCHSYSRHDFVVGDDGRAWWLEINTLPGLSRAGNLARMALADGIPYELLLTHILRGADIDRRTRP